MKTFRFNDRGPTSSAKHNERIRDLVNEFSELYGKVSAISADLDELSTLSSLDASSVAGFMVGLQARIDAAESATADSFFAPVSGMTVVRNGQNAVQADGSTVIASPLHVDPRAGVVTLPQGSYVSKMRMTQTNGGDTVIVIHPEVAANYTYTGTEKTKTALLDAVDGKMSTAFLLEPTAVTDDGILAFYAKVPIVGVATERSNVFEITLAPSMYCQLLGLQYTTDANPTLTNSDDWNDFEVTTNAANALYYPPRFNSLDPYNSTYHQKDFGSRRYYVNEEKITAVRAIVAPRTDGSGVPVPLTVSGDDRLLIGIRDLDVGHVNFSDSGELVFEIDLPEPAATLSAVSARVINDRYVGVYAPTVTCYVEQSPGVWSQIVVGETGATALGGATKVRVKIASVIVNSTVSPVISGLDLSYT